MNSSIFSTKIVVPKACRWCFTAWHFLLRTIFAKKEMAIREAPGIPFLEYKKEHQRFTAGISRFQERFSLGETGICGEMIEFMMEWLLNYIHRFGTEAPEYMRTQGFE